MKVGLVFQGGGAKGVYHVGAFRSVEDLNNDPEVEAKLEVVGLAGTSIGAIVASLVAVGFSSKDLITEDGNIVGIGSGEQIPKFFIGKRRWFQIHILREYLRSRFDQELSRSFYYFINFLIILLFITISLGSYYLFYILLNFVSTMTGVILLPLTVAHLSALLSPSPILLIAMYIYFNFPKGIVDISSLGVVLNDILASKIATNDEEKTHLMSEGVKFEDLNNRDSCISDLRIVATNISTGKLKIFSSKTTPNMNISDAIIASVSIPLLFPPKNIDNEYFCDGGLMSNSPAWVFDFDRIVDPDLHTIIFDIEKENKDVLYLESRGFFSLIKVIYKSLYAGILGEKTLEIKPSSRNIVIPIGPQETGLLDFDLSSSDIRKCVKRGYTVCSRTLRNHFFYLRCAREVAGDKILSALDLLRRAHLEKGNGDSLGKRTRRGRERVFFSGPREDDTILRVYYSSDQKSTSDRLFLMLNDTLAGESFDEKRIIHATREQISHRSLSLEQNRYRRALKKGDGQAAWSAHIPVECTIRGESTTRIVSLESNLPMDHYGLGEDTTAFSWVMLGSICKDWVQQAIDFETIDEAFEPLEEPI